MKRVTAPLSLIVAFAASIVALLAQQPSAPAALQRGGGLGAQLPPGGAAPQLDRLTIPKGFSIAIWADKVPGARSMALGADDTVYVGTQRGDVYAVVDRNRDNKADDVLTVASGLTQPNGVAFRDGSLYVAEISRISRYDNVGAFAKAGAGAPAPKPVAIYDQFPTDRPHGWKYLAFGPDGLLYTQVGAPGNIVERPDPYASIVRMKADGSGMEIFARGVRNSVGMAWHPDTRELWFTDNGRDMLGDESPNDELNTAPKAGLHFGYPYCHEDSISDPEFGAKRPCSEFAGPAAKLGPHVAALGLKFYTGTQFPTEYRKQLFIVNHGSWNRGASVSHTGYRLMIAKLKDNKVVSYEPFVEGWLLEGGRQSWGRPVDLLVLPDGSMLVSDDRANLIYRVTYRG